MRIVVDFAYVLTDRDRHGTRRYYYRRRKGEPKIRLQGQPGTTAFQASYEAARVAAEAPLVDEESNRLSAPRPGTYRWLCVEYFGSAEYRRLDPRTQRTRRGIIEHTFDEPIAPGDRLTFANFPLERMTSKAVRILRDRKAGLPEAANNRVKALRRVFAWALEHEHVASNPARDVAYVRNATEGHHTWTPAEIAAFEARHPVGTKARLAMCLLLFTGLRRSDAVLLGRQHARQGWFKLVLQKNKRRKPVTVELPILPALQAALDAGPTGDLTYLVTEHGKPFTSNGFGNWFRDRCNEAGLPQCSAHGLRKAGAAVAAENGATVHQLMAIFGWLTMRQAETYTRAAERKRLAGDAMGLLIRQEPKDGTKSPHLGGQ